MAIKSQGTLVEISNEDAAVTLYGAATFVEVGQTADVGEPSGEAAEIDVTHLQSTAKEYLIGLPDNGNIQIGGNFVPGDLGQLELVASLDGQEQRYLRITWSDLTVWYYTATCKKYGPSAAVDGKVPFTASFRTTGTRVIV